MLSRVTAGDVLERVVQALADMRSPERLLTVLLTETLRMLDAQGAYMLWLSGDRLQLRASAGLVPPGREAGLAVGSGIEGWVAQQGEALAVANLARYTRSGPEDLGIVGALLAVPMRLRGNVVGVLAATRAMPGRFAESDRWWLTIFAELGAVALENDRLLDRERRRAREAELLAELASLPLEPLSEFAARLAASIAPVLDAERFEIWLADSSGRLRSLGAPAPAAAAPRPAATGAPPRYAVSHPEPSPPAEAPAGPLAALFKAGDSLLCNETQESPALVAELRSPALRSVLAVPLWVGEARRGLVWAGAARPGAFSPDDRAFLALVAGRVGLRLGTAELTQQQAQLARAEVEQQAKQDFLSVVSHELKTPVAVIKAYTEVLEGRAERAGASAEERDVLTRIGEQADRMLGLVEQFLDLQRIEAGLMPLEESRVDLVEMARRLTQATQVTTTKHRLRVEGNRPVVVHADRRRIEQVLQNLLDNAIKYSPRGGPIVVQVGWTTAPDGSRHARVSVRDQGIGISAESAKHVFERFYQAGGAPVRGHVGLGLGLYISREIIERHGGEMGIESEEGSGSTFWFTLPASGRPRVNGDRGAATRDRS